ncbi:glutathione S-transferase P 1-like isoform X2 [Littorina saxatilis]|uniref:Glutathione S-transferase n=2 Tax=Littorina saxatilis TaxID=31220 RepID=A0AAN9GJ32_9CAEN
MSEEAWKLYYHSLERLQGSYGRAEFVRLVLEEAGVSYKMVHDNIAQLFKGGEWQGYPAFAPPLIQRGDFSLSQTGVICKFLGKKYGLYPTTEEDEWHADQLNTTVHDYIAEGRLSFHGKEWASSYLEQVEETKPYQEYFIKERMPKFLQHFEKALTANNGGKGFLVGNSVTYVDLALLHVLRATEAQFPAEWGALTSVPLLKAYQQRLQQRPRLQEYFNSDRWRPFSGNSMM